MFPLATSSKFILGSQKIKRKSFTYILIWRKGQSEIWNVLLKSEKHMHTIICHRLIYLSLIIDKYYRRDDFWLFFALSTWENRTKLSAWSYSIQNTRISSIFLTVKTMCYCALISQKNKKQKRNMSFLIFIAFGLFSLFTSRLLLNTTN
jgi:hypothetical protein